jgi:hypothetical protein
MEPNSGLLPEQFAALEEFAPLWGDLTTVSQRYVRRQETSFEELKRFWQTMAPRLEEIFDYLERFPRSQLPEREARLFRLALGLTEAAEAVEFLGRARMVGAPFPHLVDVNVYE